MDGGERPDPPPTLEIVGTVFSFLETLKSEITCLQRERDDLEELLRQIDSMRLDIAKADSA